MGKRQIWQVVALLMLWLTTLMAAFVQAEPSIGLGGTHDVTRINDDVYVMMPKFGGANATVIINEHDVVVVDPHSTPPSANALIAQIEALTDKPVGTVINTHMHGDHHGGNEAFYKRFPNVKIIAHANTRSDIVDIASKELKMMAGFYQSFYKKAQKYLDENRQRLNQAQIKLIEQYIKDETAFVAGAKSYQYHLPNMTILNELMLHDKRRNIELVYIENAHTRGDLAVYLKKDKILVSGDLVTSPYVVPRSGYPKSYAKALRQLAHWPFETLVVGHGGPVKNDRKLMIAMADFMDAVVKVVKQAKSDNVATDKIADAVLANNNVKAFEPIIDWDEPKGMKFLTFERLVKMTVQRALAETKFR